MSGSVRIGTAQRWQCSGCGAAQVTPRLLIPRDRRCQRCRGELPPVTIETGGTSPPTLRARLPEYLEAAGVPHLYRAMNRQSWEAQVLTLPDRPQVHFPRLGVTFRKSWPEPLEGWQGERDHWLVSVRGFYGTGKTGFATALFAEAIAGGLTRAVWLDAGTWLRRLRAGFSERDGSSDREFERAVSCRLLLLDDLGAAQSFGERAAGWWRLQIAQLLRERHMWNRPTILTCNALDLEAAFGAIDPSLPSRLDVPLQIEIRGPDLRRER